jgi:hypothetical protein
MGLTELKKLFALARTFRKFLSTHAEERRGEAWKFAALPGGRAGTSLAHGLPR